MTGPSLSPPLATSAESPPPASSSSSSPSTSFCPRLDPLRHLNLSEIAIIAEFLDPVDIIRAQLVCRRWRTILDSYHISRVALISHFPMAKETYDYKLARQRESLLPVEHPATPATTSAPRPNEPSSSANTQPATLLSRRSPDPDTANEHVDEATAKGRGKRPAREMDPDSEREKKREKEEDADGDARLQFRRCVYRSHTRMMGMPTQVLWHRLDPGGDGDPEYPLEWDITGGHVAWISGSEVLNVQNIYTGARGRINFVKEMVDRDIVMLREDPKINVQIGDNIVCITLNFYETSEDGYGSGRAAQCLVFEAEPLKFLWHTDLRDGRLLGEVDTTRGRFSYIRKRPKQIKYGPWGAASASLPPESDQSELAPTYETHLVVRDLITGEFMREILLERGHELTLGDVFFIIVTDSSFRRLICLYQPGHMTTPLGDFVCARIYSLDDPDGIGKVLDTRALAKNPDYWISTERNMGIDSDIYMDYPPRIDMFDIAEGMYTWARIPSVTEVDTDSSSASPPPPTTGSETPTTAACDDLLRLARSLPAINAPIIPSVIPYHSWNVLTAGDPDKLRFTQNRYLSTFSLAEDSFRLDRDHTLSMRAQLHQWSRDREPLLGIWPTENCSAFDVVRRFEVFLPVADAAAVFVATSNNTFNVDMAEYQDASKAVANRWEAHYEEAKTTNPETGEQRGTSLINGILKRMLEVEVLDDKEGDEETTLSDGTSASVDGEDLDVKAIRRAFKEAGLTPAKLAVPVTRTLRRAGRRTLGTGRLQRWTSMETQTISETSSSENGKGASKGKAKEETYPPVYSDPSNNPEIVLPNDPRIPIFLDPETGNIGVKGHVSPSFLQSVQWTEDFLAVQTRFLAPEKKQLGAPRLPVLPVGGSHEEDAGDGDQDGGRDVGTANVETREIIVHEEVNAVVVFDFRAPW